MTNYFLLLAIIVWLLAVTLTTPDTDTTCQAQETVRYDVCTLELTR